MNTKKNLEKTEKALRIGSVMRSFDVDFNGHTKVRIGVTDDHNIKIVAGMNGWGDALDLSKITIEDIS